MILICIAWPNCWAGFATDFIMYTETSKRHEGSL